MADIQKLVGLTITNVDIQKGIADGTGYVYLDAIGADETPDIDDEIFDYSSSKPFVEAWSKSSSDTTKAAGQAVSYGNIRAQHGREGSGNAAGTIAEPITFDDKDRSIRTRIKVVDQDACRKVAEGVYRGLSVRGRLVGKKWKDGQYYRYTVDPVEFSLVDKPANPNATITVVKADGSTEVRKVADAKTKRVAGKDLTASSFAYVGDPEKTETWKLPVMDASHTRNALARLDQTEGIPADKKASVKSKIMRAARRFGIDAKSLDEEKKGAFVGTGMGSVSSLACLLDQLFYLRDTTLFEADAEDDDSEIPERLSELLETAAEILKDMTSEEVEELIEMDATKAADVPSTETEIEKAAKTRFQKAKAAHAELGDHLEKAAAASKRMASHFKQDDDSDDEAAKAAESDEEEKKAKKKKDEDEKEKADKEDEKDEKKSATIATLTAQVAALTDIVSKMSVSHPVPIIAPGSRIVAKSDGKEDLLDKRAALDKSDPEYIDKAYRVDTAAEPEMVKL